MFLDSYDEDLDLQEIDHYCSEELQLIEEDNLQRVKDMNQELIKYAFV